MSKAKVLIVESDPLMAVTMREVLTLVGFEVAGIVNTVTDALGLAENTRPDLAIFDVRLSGRRDGIEGAALLRECFGLPAVFVTAPGDEATRQRASLVGAVGYIDKPVHPQELIKVVDAVAGQNGGNRLTFFRAWNRSRACSVS
jgi:DNA-binding response OmpR family regulator